MYYVRIRGKVFGPLEEKQIVDMVRQGKLGRMNEISNDSRQWVRADEFEQFFPKAKSKRKPLSDSFELSVETATNEITPKQPALGTPKSRDNATAAVWFYSNDGKTGMGPISYNNIVQMIRQGDVIGKTILWRDELDPQAAEILPDFASFFQNVDGGTSRKTRKKNHVPQTRDDTSAETQLHSSDETLEQTERAATWAFVSALFATIVAAAFLIAQLFQFVLITRSNSVLLTLGFLLLVAAIDVTLGYVLLAFWRYVNAMKQASRKPDDTATTLAARRMAEFWRASVLAPLALCAFLLLATLLAFAAGTNPLQELQNQQINERINHEK